VSVQFRILGSVEVETGGKSLSLPSRRERCLLGVLLLEANRVVSVERLAGLLWEGEPPKRLRGAVQGSVSRLRATLGRAGDSDRVDLVFAGDGYRLAADPETVDAHRFWKLLERAGQMPDVAERAEQLRAALELWRGPALEDAVSGLARERLCADLEEQRLAAFEDFASASLTLRRERAVVPELARLSSEHPGRESLVGLHMRALYQAGRRVDALDVYARARAYLADELGLDPGSELRKLHQAILRDEVTVPVSLTSRSEPGPFRSVVPRQLPADVAGFTGRMGDLAQLDGLLRKGDAAPSIVISAIGGTAGVGKTALAVHWAHQVADRFPDGQLFIDLHGYTRGMAAVEPSDALDRMLRALGVPGGQVPVEVDDRAALWRSVLAGRRMLIVLDNVAAETQVQPLLPGVPGCLVLVTSRRRLAGLDAAQTLSLDMLPRMDAVTLFARTVGEDRLTNQSHELVAEAVDLCGRLPLAIRIAAARLRSHPVWNVADLVERLRDEGQRLAELEDAARGVATALDLSYQQLSAEQQHLYRLLGLHPGPEIEPNAVAALADRSPTQARRCLDELLDAHLLQEPASGRFVFHDLIRAHASGIAFDRETDASRVAALGRLLDHYRHVASMAMDAAYGYEQESRPRVPPSGAPVPDLSNPALATAWLDIELPNLRAVAEYAAGQGLIHHTWHLSATLHRHLRTRGRYREDAFLLDRALMTARAAGFPAGELDALNGLGDIHYLQGRHELALDHYRQALEIAQAIGNHSGELNGLLGLGNVHRLTGRHELALDHFGRALEIAQAIGDHSGELNGLVGLGNVYRLTGRHEPALDHFGRALEIARATGNHTGELDVLIGLGQTHRKQSRHELALHHYLRALEIARTTGSRTIELISLLGLGHVHVQQSRHEPALDHYQQALEIARDTGNHTGELSAIIGLGHVHLQQGRCEEAAGYYQRVLADAREIANRNWQFEALQGLGRVENATGRPEAALDHHHQALELAIVPSDHARAHDGLAHAHHALKQLQQAREHWRYALDILTSLGIDHTEDREASVAAIRARLT
jgi:tetratricopeptide (TPR) repeat protein/DNA-binding SARP family transcriptional activator